MKTQGIAPVFQVSSVDAAVKHYVSVLGFTEQFRGGDYAVLVLGEVHVHVSAHSVYPRPIGGSAAYIYCDEVDTYFGEVKSRGAEVKTEPKDWPYSMRDFTVADIDGNLLHFGCEIHKQGDNG
jgi:uncharacterized glyoxalase superfamily protein PhnB